ncbi:protein son of sevenless [Condylostylus longicornis]|uniref:protein son of sevenless n=1 Tax=Condylostylus longicornis TaxID=2530218 RepID=UPI00244DB9B6|nr:protein son of sevenless [Condylostylus longicornis]
MFSGSISELDYDFEKSENAVKWKGLFAPALKKVLEQVHPNLTAREDALFYVESLCLRLLAKLCAKPPPHTIQDIEERVGKTFPKPIHRWALNDARDTIDKSKKKKSVLPVDRVHTMLQKEVLQYKIDSSVTLFLVAVLESVSGDIFDLAGNYVKNIKHVEMSREDIEVAMCADKALMDMFSQGNSLNTTIPSQLPQTPRASTSYEDVVKDLIHDEKQYQRDLHMIIRVFREELLKIVNDPKDLEPIFSNIFDIYEVTITLLGSLEDVIEMAEEQNKPCVGSCFEELAEAAEFDVYIKYARDVTSQHSRDALSNLLSKPDANSLISAGHGFREAVKYYLPKLLLVPIWHAFLYLDYINTLKNLSKNLNEDDHESFEQVQGLLKPLQTDLENIVATLPNGFYNEFVIRMHSKARRQLASERSRDLEKTVDNWEVVGNCYNEFIREDTLKLSSGKRVTERKVYLFDGLLVLCKANTRRPVGGNTPQYDFRLKEHFYMRHVEIIDRQDTDELKHAFEISPRTHPAVVLIAKNAQHKNDWMADLIMVNTKSMLDRILNSILSDIEKKHPLRLPSPDIYKFAVPDSPDNIVLEERESTGVPLIKGATLCKLIERLTYHIYADPMFVRTFLTTYRYFCAPQELLQLLIGRFNIPDPSLVYQDNLQNSDQNMETDKIHKNSHREDWKRYKKEYVQPVQFRVLNVLRHWVDNHFYDFEKDPSLLSKLLDFLSTVNGKSMKKWVDSVLKIVQRKEEQEEKTNRQITFAFNDSPPAIECHLEVPETKFNLLTLHPLELARQLTLLEFELYKNVKPSELVGSPYAKNDKQLNSPNVLKIMKHSTDVSRWIEKSIVEAENFEERVAILTRAIEVMYVMFELNNFNGMLSIIAVTKSAAVHRLTHTFNALSPSHKKILEEMEKYNDGHLQKIQEKLRSINPPCVPFVGKYLTNILHLEDGNPDFLPNTELINFSKRRKVAEIIGEIQQYQNQPYCLKIDPRIRRFLENLNPFEGMLDADQSNYLYKESLRIEPRNCKVPPRFPRKWPEYSLKSPGIKPRRHNNSSSSNNSNSTISSSIISPGYTGGGHVNNAATCSEGELSPTSTTTTISLPMTSSRNAQDHSVFANVNIVGRSGSSHQHQHSFLSHSSTQTLNSISPGAIGGVSPNEVPSNFDRMSIASGNYSSNSSVAPELPKRSNSIISTDGSIKPPILSPANISGSRYLSTLTSHQKHRLMEPLSESNSGSQINSFNYGGNFSSANVNNINEQSPPPISPHRISSNSPRSESVYNNKNRNCLYSFSPNDEHLMANHATNENLGTTNYGFSPSSPKFHTNHQAGSKIQNEINLHGETGPVPLSPHVNVPTTSHGQIPPPLPPRRQERLRKPHQPPDVAQLAQKRQAPDAPQLPPRDGDPSPPPLPPRTNHICHSLNHSHHHLHHHHSMHNYSISSQHVQQLCTPVMASVNLCRSNNPTITVDPLHGVDLLMGQNNLMLPHSSTLMMRRNSAMERAAKQSANSNTDITMSNKPTNNVIPSNGTNIQNVININCQKANIITNTNSINSYSTKAISPASSSSATASPITPITPISPRLHHHQQSHQQKQLIAHSHSQSLSSDEKLDFSSTSTSTTVATVTVTALRRASTNTPPRFSPGESTPKLPPKPKFSMNCYHNSSDKITMFPYPSTNQE